MKPSNTVSGGGIAHATQYPTVGPRTPGARSAIQRTGPAERPPAHTRAPHPRPPFRRRQGSARIASSHCPPQDSPVLVADGFHTSFDTRRISGGAARHGRTSSFATGQCVHSRSPPSDLVPIPTDQGVTMTNANEFENPTTDRTDATHRLRRRRVAAPNDRPPAATTVRSRRAAVRRRRPAADAAASSPQGRRGAVRAKGSHRTAVLSA